MDTTANATLAAWQPCAGCGQPVDLTVAHRTQGNYVLHDDDRCEETFDVAILRLFVDEERYQHRSKRLID